MSKKSGKNKLEIVDPPAPEHSFAEETLASWIQEHGSKLIYGLTGFVLIAGLLLIWAGRNSQDTEETFLAAKQAFERFQASSAADGAAAQNPEYLKLKSLISADPDLGARYYGPLAQTFLRLGDTSLALAYGDKALKALTRENLPFYEDFSKTSLLVASGDESAALQRAEFLHKKMRESDPSLDKASTERGFGDILYLSNALRLAMLHQHLGNGEEELRHWQELSRLLNEDQAESRIQLDQAMIAELKAAFKTGKVAFNDYIEARTNHLRR